MNAEFLYNKATKYINSFRRWLAGICISKKVGSLNKDAFPDAYVWAVFEDLVNLWELTDIIDKNFDGLPEEVKEAYKNYKLELEMFEINCKNKYTKSQTRN